MCPHLQQKFSLAFRCIANAPRDKAAAADSKPINPVADMIESKANARVKELFSTVPPARNKVRQNDALVLPLVSVTRWQIAKRIQELASDDGAHFDDDSLHEQVWSGCTLRACYRGAGFITGLAFCCCVQE
jgi:hypothetical protein